MPHDWKTEQMEQEFQDKKDELVADITTTKVLDDTPRSVAGEEAQQEVDNTYEALRTGDVHETEKGFTPNDASISVTKKSEDTKQHFAVKQEITGNN